MYLYWFHCNQMNIQTIHEYLEVLKLLIKKYRFQYWRTDIEENQIKLHLFHCNLHMFNTIWSVMVNKNHYYWHILEYYVCTNLYKVNEIHRKNLVQVLSDNCLLCHLCQSIYYTGIFSAITITKYTKQKVELKNEKYLYLEAYNKIYWLLLPEETSTIKESFS